MSSNSNVFRETTNVPQQAPPSFLQKKGLLGNKGKSASLGGNTMSPTDQFMSPVSAKLNGAKQRHFQKKPVPFASKLSSLAASAAPDSPAPSEKKH